MARVRFLLGAILALILLHGTAAATPLVFVYEGTSNKGVDVKFQAELSISGDILTIVLSNLSDTDLSSPSLNPDDVFTSFYFAIAGSPTLTWETGEGDVYTGNKDIVDPLFDAGHDLTTGASRWDFVQGLTGLQPGTTALSYGIGAAGNNSLEVCCGAGFTGSVTDGVDFGIYAGDVSTSNLEVELVKTIATFTFSGVNGLTEDDISDEALFGLGTQPDSTGFVPEPGTGLLLGLGLAVLAARRRRC